MPPQEPQNSPEPDITWLSLPADGDGLSAALIIDTERPATYLGWARESVQGTPVALPIFPWGAEAIRAAAARAAEVGESPETFHICEEAYRLIAESRPWYRRLWWNVTYLLQDVVAWYEDDWIPRLVRWQRASFRLRERVRLALRRRRRDA